MVVAIFDCNSSKCEKSYLHPASCRSPDCVKVIIYIYPCSGTLDAKMTASSCMALKYKKMSMQSTIIVGPVRLHSNEQPGDKIFKPMRITIHGYPLKITCNFIIIHYQDVILVGYPHKRTMSVTFERCGHTSM